MWKIALAELGAHKRRLIGTCSAIILGVALLSGTLILGDTMRNSFDSMFAKANANTDVIVRGSQQLGSEETERRNNIPVSTVETVAAVDGVAAAAPEVQGAGQILAADGTPLGGQGPPTLAWGWVDDPVLNPMQIAEGRAPTAPGEAVIDSKSATDGDLSVGSTTSILVPDPVPVTIVGIAKFGDDDTIGTVTYTAFSLPEAQRLLLGSDDEISSVVAKAADGVSDEELQSRIAAALPPTSEALTSTELTAEQNASIEADFLGFLETFLLVFTGVAMLVASLSIANTFAVILAQRTRQSALLRALGASRRQILSSITVEAVLIGIVSSVIGLGVGALLATGLTAAADAAGFGVPSAGLVVSTSTVIAAMVVGLVVTVLASLLPAIKASRVPPLAALRDVAQDRSATSKVRNIAGAIVTVAGVAMVAATAIGGGELLVVGLGSLLSVVGLLMLGPLLAGPASRITGAPIRALRGVSGELAGENARRNPRRTSSTASALIIGLGVVTLFSVFGASIKQSIDESASEGFHGDLVVMTAGFSGAGLSPQMATEIAELPEVSTSSALSYGTIGLPAEQPGDPLDQQDVSIVDPGPFQELFGLEVVDGSMTDLPGESLIVPVDTAQDQGWSAGQQVDVTFGDGASVPVTIAATYEETDLMSGLIMPESTWTPHASQTYMQMMLLEVADGVSVAQGQEAVKAVAADFGSPDVMDRDEYVASVSAEVDAFLTIVYVLLALSVLIAAMGIANTLSLAIHERTRELGLLRAIGQTRSQLRSMVRWESVIVAIFGAVSGVVLGTFLAWGLVKGAMADSGLGSFAAPVGQLVFIVVVGGAIGIVASLRPASRAAKLDVLGAIATD